ncbi:hypothetical protein QA597_07180 [Marinilabiliaceae bacterium ANBcel2]|nr:hypothetical protein [Marinilabiliaceae bacterium ANBcel2]
MIRFAVIVIVSIFVFKPVSGNNSFTEGGTGSFLDIIDDIYSISSDRRAARNFMSKIEDFWESPSLSQNIKEDIVQIADLMLEQRARPFPEYHNYLKTVITFVDDQHPEKKLTDWHNAINSLLSNPDIPLRHVNNLFEITFDLLENNIIFSTPAVTWYGKNPSYNFLYTDSLYLNITNNTTITCKVRQDTISIYNTKGTLNLMSGEWNGEGGVITWEQSGFDRNSVYAEINIYKIDMTRNRFNIDSVKFYNRNFFNHYLKGDLSHRVRHIRTPSASSYPQFESFEQRYTIENIQPGFNYEGGFSQHGAKVLGSGTDENPAKIEIFRNDTLFITAKSQRFALREDQIVSNQSQIEIDIDDNSISHPGLLFKYMHEKQEVQLIRDGDGISRTPFYNSYHNIYMDVEMMTWILNDSFMSMGMSPGAAENHAIFESISYFRESYFNRLQGIESTHPLQGIMNCYREYKKEPFTAKEYAQFRGLPQNQIRQQLLDLTIKGFVNYSTTTDSIYVNSKLKNYLQFRAQLKDYDVIRFRSQTPRMTPNAIFDLRNYDLELKGVKNVSISDKQNVTFFPDEERLLLKKDRNFSFDGAISSGMISMHGNGFIFNYEDFRIDLDRIDSLQMAIHTGGVDSYGRPVTQRINNTVSELSGYLQIDKPDNKSGNKDNPQYPILTSTTNSFVYYDYQSVQNGAYKREEFYFKLDPFEMKSLNRLNRNNIEFTGDFHSNIFPVIEETLIVRDDRSLGFNRETPAEGYNIYNQRATFTNSIDLSNKGLIGSGTLSYITTEAFSHEFTFLPEETHGLAERFEVNPSSTGIEFPDLQGSEIAVNYLPYEEELLADITQEPFSIFNNEAFLSGDINISPNGLAGGGRLDIAETYLISDNYIMEENVVIADTADFNISIDESADEVSFKTDNLLAHIDFEERKGTFSSHDAGSKIDFTENRYIAYISDFSWNMDNNEISLGSSGSEGNRFVSTHRRQDSLDFYVPLANYDIQNHIIHSREVVYIEVGDTKMILDDGMVTIYPNAVLDTLNHVTIEIEESQHSFHNSQVEILGKYDYEASGQYEFINGDKNIQIINFSQIGLNNDNITNATGEISEEEIFTFNQHFAFKGDVALEANEELLNFTGGAQMLHKCHQNGPQEYVRFNSAIDPDSVMIPVGEEVQNYEYDDIYTSIYLNRDSNQIYSSFFEERWFYNDAPLISANGVLHYNRGRDSYMITGEEWVANPDTTGNILMFSNNGCNVTGSGIIDIGLDLSPVEIYTSGEVKNNRRDSLTTLNTLFALDFYLDEVTTNMIAEGIRYAEGAEEGEPEGYETIKRMSEWISEDVATDVARELQGFEPMESLPEEHQHMLVFDDLQWKWDKNERAYIANSTATVMWVKNQQVNREVEVKAKINFSRGGNSMDMLINVTEDEFYFFSYRNSEMQTRSSSEEYNRHVQALDEDERRIRNILAGRHYSFILSSEARLRSLEEFFENY